MFSTHPNPRWPLTRRSTFLVFMGLAWLVIGCALLTTPPQLRAPSVATYLAPAWFWGWIWVTCGATAIITGALRWLKSLGFAALMFIGFMWTMVQVGDWAVGNSPRGWVGAVVFSAVTFAVYSVAGMLDGADHHRPRR